MFAQKSSFIALVLFALLLAAVSTEAKFGGVKATTKPEPDAPAAEPAPEVPADDADAAADVGVKSNDGPAHHFETYSTHSFWQADENDPTVLHRVSESKRSLYNSETGIEEVSTTKRLGEKSRTEHVVRQHDGSESRKVSFENMDEGELAQFEDQWSQAAKDRLPAPSNEKSTEALGSGAENAAPPAPAGDAGTRGPGRFGLSFRPQPLFPSFPSAGQILSNMQRRMNSLFHDPFFRVPLFLSRGRQQAVAPKPSSEALRTIDGLRNPAYVNDNVLAEVSQLLSSTGASHLAPRWYADYVQQEKIRRETSLGSVGNAGNGGESGGLENAAKCSA